MYTHIILKLSPFTPKSPKGDFGALFVFLCIFVLFFFNPLKGTLGLG